jgi:hypothetical protein
MKGVIGSVCLTCVLVVAGCAGEVDQPDNPGAAGNDGSGADTSVGGDGSGGSGTDTGGSASTSAGGAGGAGTGGAGGQGPQTVADCYANAFANPVSGGPDYDQFGTVVGSHCLGTNHQAIAGVQRVVFLGDSVTVGTPPTLSDDFYRSQLADSLAQKFGLPAPSFLWKLADPFSGKSFLQDDGAFASCAEWGARTDDLLPEQLPNCFPQNKLDKTTLVIMTMGGNDISQLAQSSIDGVAEMELWQQTQDLVQYQRDALDWLVEPGRFPNGVYVMFANMFEFTDGTGEVESCDVSALAGFDEPVPSPEQLKQMVIWANEQFIKMAVDTGTDAIFLLEEFCGHGFNADDPSVPCYRGPGTPTWFDLTCIHPNPVGHDQVTDMFMAVVNE